MEPALPRTFYTYAFPIPPIIFVLLPPAPSLVVTQIRGHTAGSSTARALHRSYRAKGSALSSLVDSSRNVFTHAINRRARRLKTPYELIQAYNPKLRQPRMPHAMTTRTLHFWYHTDRHKQWKRAAKPVTLFDLGLALSPKMCPDQSQAFNEVNNSKAFPKKEKVKTCFFHFFPERAAIRCSRACLYKVCAKYSKS